MEPGDFTDIERLFPVWNPASRSVDIQARSHNPHTGPRVYERAVFASREENRGEITDPLMTLDENAAWGLFKELIKMYATDMSVLEFNDISRTMDVKVPASLGRFTPVGEHTPLEALLSEKVDLLERLLKAKDENLADIRNQLTYTYTEIRDPNVPLTIPKLEEGY